MGQGQASSILRGRQLEDVCEIPKGSHPLGKGSFGTVWRARLKAGGGGVAVKALDKRRMAQMKVPAELVASEVALMRECTGQERFVQLKDFIESRGSFYLILELCEGDLESAAKGSADAFGEPQVVRMVSHLIQALAFLHHRRICHRDVKPQNVMLVGNPSSEHVKVKLGDFGIAVRVKQGVLLTEKVGTPAFMAPEMHLLPSKSRGYTLSVDLWAAGVVIVFLLAHEYPFVDGSGQLLRDQLLKGDVPLWSADVFSSLFHRVQEVAGMRRPKPSSVARDLVRRLLTPKWQERLSATGALRHDWFVRPLPKSEPQDDLPLLHWQDFEDGIAGVERELHRMASDMAEAVGNVQVSLAGCDPPLQIDPSDDRLQTCVVCFSSSGSLGYLCPQCHHTVCLSCVAKLPKPECPYCRHEASDVATAQRLVHFARRMSPEAAMAASQAALQAALEVGVNDGLGKVATNVEVDIDPPWGVSGVRTQEEQLRRDVCHLCRAPSSATSHVCPLCSASVCYTCARSSLAADPRCPNCGDVHRNSAVLKEYLAAGEAWHNALGLAASMPSTLSERATEVFGALSSRAGLSIDGVPSVLLGEFHQSTSSDTPDRVVRELRDRAQLPLMCHKCHFCGCESSSLDLACTVCSTSVCLVCARVRFNGDTRCPCCRDPDFVSALSLHVTTTAVQVRDSARSLLSGFFCFGQETVPDLVLGSTQPPLRPSTRVPPRQLPKPTTGD